ncbi:hypothetical protein JW905_18255, partial [bacterium]|nr:hypothetical protein [candidate division CSSED10-310 bacterium]
RLTPGMIEALAATDRRTITLAPECGLPGARRMIGKSLADETLLDAVAQLCRAGIVTIKLYFMVGLPDLTPRDESAAIAALAGKVSHVLRTESRTGSPATRLAVSVAGFVPKPWTPYQWKSMRSEGDLKIAIKDLERRLKPMRGVTFLHDVPKWSRIEGLLARGDRRLAHLLLAVHECEGNWSRALRRVNLNPAFYVDRRRDHDEILPWDHLQSGEDKAALIAACGMDTPR